MAGNESLFVKRMNEEARQIGLKKSSFTNPTGLHDPGHQMTARELAILARHIIRTYPEFYELFALKEFNYLKHRFINRNPLLGQVAGLDGLKTGFTKEAGHGIVASAKQDGRRLIAVIAGDATADDRRDDGRRLLEWGYRAFAETKLFDAGEIVGHARVWGGQRMYVPLSGKGDINVWLPRNMANQKLRASIVYQWPLKPPLKRGEQVAVLRVTTSSETMNEVPLFVAEDVELAGPMRRGFDSILCLATRWLP
jgi:D-alanyl-D-alanine carboxypeptidase (penicillin-binding protein 5/6)